MSTALDGTEEAEESGRLLRQLAHSLHEMCQPLTALLCRLELGQMEREGAPPDSIDLTLAECVRECDRLNERVNTMRALVRSALSNERGTQG